MRCGGLYLFSGLLNEVTQVVLLNTFPISIMNHLLLIIPVQPRGLAFIQRNGLHVHVLVRARAPLSMHARASVCSKSAQSTKRGDKYSPCDGQKAGCLMRKWMRGDIHWLPFTHRPPTPPHSLFSTAFRLPLRRARGSHSNH